MHTHRLAALRFAAPALLMGLASCQVYEPAPLDLVSYREGWLARSGSSEPVVEFAKRLATKNTTTEETFDPSDGLSLSEGEIIAMVFNPALRIARRNEEVARVFSEHAGLWRDPVLSVDLERILASVDQPWIAGGTLGLTLPFSGRLEAEKDHAFAARTAAIRQVVADEWRVRIEVRAAWHEWSAAKERSQLARVTLDRVNAIVEVVDRLEQSGEIGRVDARLIHVDRQTRLLDLELLEARTREVELVIRALIGLAPSAAVSFIATSLADQPRTTIDQSLASLELRNPELEVLRAKYEVSEQVLRRETREQYPDLTINPGGKVEDGDTRLLFGLSLPLAFWNKNLQGIAEATMDREVARATFESGFERLAMQLAQAYLRYETAHGQRDALESRIAPLADEQYADVLRLAELGRVDTLVLLEAVTRQHAIKTRLLEASLSEVLAVNEIRSLIGPEVSTHSTSVEETNP